MTEREKLAAAIRSLRACYNQTHIEWKELERLVYDAAQKYLDSLPETKSMWRVTGVWGDGGKAGPADFSTLTMAAGAGEVWYAGGCRAIVVTQVEVPA